MLSTQLTQLCVCVCVCVCAYRIDKPPVQDVFLPSQAPCLETEFNLIKLYS